MHTDTLLSFPTDDMMHVNNLFTNYFPDESHVEGDLVTWGLMTDSNNRQCLELILHVAYPGFIRITTAISEMVISHLHLHDPGKARISYPGVIELLA